MTFPLTVDGSARTLVWYYYCATTSGSFVQQQHSFCNMDAFQYIGKPFRGAVFNYSKSGTIMGLTIMQCKELIKDVALGII